MPEDRQEKLWAYFFGVASAEQIKLVAAGGTANHVHLLIALPPTLSLSQAMQKLKGNASRGWEKISSGSRAPARSA
ncbi:MAG: transposase [Terriglobales bacterium]